VPTSDGDCDCAIARAAMADAAAASRALDAMDIKARRFGTVIIG
jgi:hypothetical protein